eukprot:jgi/Tetstr1/434658/TSEL_023749.t1
MDDFILFFAESEQAALALRDRVTALLDRLGLSQNPDKGSMRPVQACEHLGLAIDTVRGEFRAPDEKFSALPRLASGMLQDVHWLPARQLATLAGKAQYLYLEISDPEIHLRELQSVLATREGCGGRVKMTYKLRRDLR